MCRAWSSRNQLNFPADKEPSQQNSSGIILQSPAESSAAKEDVGTTCLLHADGGHTSPSNTSDDVEYQEAADDKPAGQHMRSLFADMPTTLSQILQRPKTGDAPIHVRPSDGRIIGEHLDSGEGQDSVTQKVHEQLPGRGIIVSAQVFPLPASSDAANGETSRRRESKEDTPAILPANNEISTEETSQRLSLHRLAASESEDVVEEALGDNKLTGQPALIIDLEPKSLYLQAQVADATNKREARSEALEEKTQNGFAAQLAHPEQHNDHDASQQPNTKSDTASNEEPFGRMQQQSFASESYQEELRVRSEMATKYNMEKEDIPFPSPVRQDPPKEEQYSPRKAPTVIQDEDTDYLHAFLTRAKARKAAREASPQKADQFPPSPMTRSRAALLPLSANSTSPNKTNKHRLKTTDDSDPLQMDKAGSPRRRSGRTRLPRPQKAPTVAQSTIPVRRSKGTEFVFLQNTDLAQIALMTRNNTKHNKGEAVLPKVKLQALSQAQRSPSTSPRRRKGKEVSWNEEPTYFGIQVDDAEDSEEKQEADERRRVRKVRRVGAVNGTPAPKKVTADEAIGVRRSVPRKRSKRQEFQGAFK